MSSSKAAARVAPAAAAPARFDGMAGGVKEVILRSFLDNNPVKGPKMSEKWKNVSNDLLARYNMDSSQQGLSRFVKKFLGDWWARHDSDSEAKDSGNHDSEVEAMSEFDRLCHDCNLLLQDAVDLKKKTGEVKTEGDAKAKFVEECGDEVIAQALAVCGQRKSRAPRADALDSVDLSNRGPDGESGGDSDDDVLDMTPSPAPKTKRRSVKRERDSNEDPAAPIGDVMGGYLAKKSKAVMEELRQKAEKQTHDMLLERERALAHMASRAIHVQTRFDFENCQQPCHCVQCEFRGTVECKLDFFFVGANYELFSAGHVSLTTRSAQHGHTASQPKNILNFSELSP